MITVKGIQLLNCGRAQARKSKSIPMEPLKANATNGLTPAITDL